MGVARGVPWPVRFPDLFEVDGATFEPISNGMAVKVESGPPMTRLRFTGEMDNFAGRLPAVLAADAELILDFWRYDLAQGTLPVTWTHPFTKAAADFLFIGPNGELAPPRFSPRGGGWWFVYFQLLRLPA